MKVYLINLKRVRKVAAFVLILALSVGITTGTLFAYDACFANYTPTGTDAANKVIIVDAGHGGEDSGAVGVNGVYEKDLNLQVANVLAGVLKEKGYTVIMTRTEDKMLYEEDQNIKGIRKISDLKNRCKVAGQYPGALFISVHMNSFGAAKYSGLQVYYSHGNDNSNALASCIQQAVKRELQHENNRVVKDGKDIYILENCPITSVLIECGFLTNADECAKLSDKEYQKELSFAIVCGIIDYIEKSKN